MDEIPEGLKDEDFLSLWEDWHAYRRERRLCPWKSITRKYQLRRLEEMGLERATKAIAHSIAQGYQGIYEERGATQAKVVSPKIKVFRTDNQGAVYPDRWSMRERLPGMNGVEITDIEWDRWERSRR